MAVPEPPLGSVDPRDRADRLVHALDGEDLTIEQVLHLAAVLIALAEVDERRNAHLLTLLSIVDDEQDKAILRAVLRRRSRVLPPPPGVIDGLNPNGGT